MSYKDFVWFILSGGLICSPTKPNVKPASLTRAYIHRSNQMAACPAAEEDKTTDTSLQYWFRCCDLDGDGRLTPSELMVSRWRTELPAVPVFTSRLDGRLPEWKT